LQVTAGESFKIQYLFFFCYAGDPKTLYDSVHQKIFTLPEDFSLFPAHDYKGLMFISFTSNNFAGKKRREILDINVFALTIFLNKFR